MYCTTRVCVCVHVCSVSVCNVLCAEPHYRFSFIRRRMGSWKSEKFISPSTLILQPDVVYEQIKTSLLHLNTLLFSFLSIFFFLSLPPRSSLSVTFIFCSSPLSSLFFSVHEHCWMNIHFAAWICRFFPFSPLVYTHTRSPLPLLQYQIVSNATTNAGPLTVNSQFRTNTIAL